MNVSLENFSDHLKPYLLQNVAICTDRKIIRKGKWRRFVKGMVLSDRELFFATNLVNYLILEI